MSKTKIKLLLDFIIVKISIYVFKSIFFFYPIQFVYLQDNRIADLIGGTGYFLRKLELKSLNITHNNFLIVSKNPANFTIIEMIKKRIPVIKSDLLKSLILKIERIKPDNIFIQHLPHTLYDPEVYDNTESPFQIPNDKISEGRLLFKRMQIPEGEPIICFFVRDQAYLNQKIKYKNHSWDYHSFRNGDLSVFQEMSELMADEGYYLVRVGSVVEKKLRSYHPKVIDYASEFRTDFGDIYLANKTKLFIGDTSGIMHIFQSQGCHGIRCNLGLGDIFSPWIKFMSIPVRYRDTKSGEIIPYKIALEKGVYNFYHTDDFNKAGIEIVHTTKNELLSAIKEKLAKIDGTWVKKDEDEYLQQKFFSLYEPNHQFSHHLTRSEISTTFLRLHTNLLN